MKLFFSVPLFFPNLEFFHGLINSDAWIVLDHVKYRTRTSQNRCRIRTSTGIQLLMVTVKRPCNKPIRQMMINNMQPWKKIFLDTIKRSYGDAPFYPQYIDGLKSIIQAPTVLLETLNVQTILWVAGLLHVQPNLIYTKHHYHSYPKSKVIPILCRKLNAEKFDEPFSHPDYESHYEPFEKNLSILDAFFSTGAEKTRKLLKKTY